MFQKQTAPQPILVLLVRNVFEKLNSNLLKIQETLVLENNLVFCLESVTFSRYYLRQRHGSIKLAIKSS